jgi:molybdopterin-guanine dinucleotide biosynthesis protein A
MAVSGIILAGGRSSRMGRDKTLIHFNNETLIERTIEKISGIADEIIIASNNTAKYNLAGCVEVPDIYPGLGPLAGMHAGLKAAKYQHSFIVSSDMPFFTAELVKYLLKHREGYDAVVPNARGHWEPLCAVYSRSCITPIERCLQAGVRQVFQLYSQVKVLKIEESELKLAGDLDELFYNLNTPEDLKQLKIKGNP